MNDKIDDGGPAFPLTEGAIDFKNRDFPMQGMTLRDWFAGLAVSGASADPQTAAMPARDLADYGYRIADAMLEARKK